MLNIECGACCTSWGLMNRPKLNKVYHSFYNFLLGRIQGEKLGGSFKEYIDYYYLQDYITPIIEELSETKEVSRSIIRFYVMIG
jgi:predicted DNA-binding protein YlxM (UPF0122 family)